jgi:hypothetical protein
MGAVVAFPGTDGSSLFPSRSIFPAWPHPRSVTLPIETLRAIDRDIRHLDSVMARINDVATISTILSTTCGAENAARAVGRFLRSGRVSL